MTHYDFFTKEFPKYLNETAFFLGNGINNFCGTTSSWKNLLIELARKHIDKTSDFEKILDEQSVSYIEFFDIIQLNSNINNPTFDYKDIKKGFKKGFSIWESQETHREWVQIIKKSNRPLLTTNYDYLLEQSDDSIVDFINQNHSLKNRFRPLRSKKGRRGFTPYYPWHNYYSNVELIDVIHEFGIWHIHGFLDYSSSIRLGLSDYMGIVTKAKTWLHRANGNPFHKIEGFDNWVGKNSWLDIFLNCHLLFVGIDLGVQETSLRWLLVEREKLYRKRPELRKSTWYVVNKKSDKKLMGKKLLFEKLNIQMVEANDFDQIYKMTPKRIASYVQ